MHGSNRLGGNSLSDLLVFGRRARAAARRTTSTGWPGCARPVAERRRRRGAGAGAAAVRQRHRGRREPVRGAPGAAADDERPGRHHPQGRRDGAGAREARRTSPRAPRTVSVEGHRQFNPGWHLALDLRNMLLVSQCVAKAALERQESRGGHTRDDFPVMDPDWRHVLLVLPRDSARTTSSSIRQEQIADAAGPARPVRARRAEEVLHRRGAAAGTGAGRGPIEHELRRTLPGLARATPRTASSSTTPSR